VRAFAGSLLLVLLAAADARAAGKAVEGAVNLNTAPPEVLALLPGIGPSKAQSILAYRKRHPFRTVDELVRIKGIGRKMVRHLRPHLAVGGPTTATASTAPTATPPTPPPPPTPPKRPSIALVCPHLPARPIRPPLRQARPTHGSCPPPP
jgi:competence protein ComEA